MFKLHRGRARIDYYPKKASTVIDVGDALMFDDDGKVTTHDGGKKKIIGIAMKNVRSTDSDYASNTKIPVQIGASEDAEFLFETTGLATTDVGQSIGVSTSDPGLASVSGLPTMVVKEYLSATLGSAALIDPIDAFGGDNSQSNNVVTVTIGGNGDYNVESTATDADVQINAAITAINAIGGGTVVIKPGTYLISEPLICQSNVYIQGQGRGFTVIKAKDGFAPTQLNRGSKYSMVITTPNTTGPSNFGFEGITFDMNGQNIDQSISMTGGYYRALWIHNPSYFYFRNNEIKNSVNYNIFVSYGSNVWIEDNYIIGGWSNTFNQNDGIHLYQCDYFFVTNNFVDTYTLSLSSASNHGDDAIAIHQNDTGYDGHVDITKGVVSNNIVAGGRRGIALNCNNANIKNTVVIGNVVFSAQQSGIKLHKSSGVGKWINVTISNNSIYNVGAGFSGSEVSYAIHVNDNSASDKVEQFINLVITGNTIDGANDTTTGAVHIPKGHGLVLSNNVIRNVLGRYGLRVGKTSNPVKDYSICNNVIDLTGSASDPIGIWLYGTERGVCANNVITGHKTGTTCVGIFLQAKATGTSDSEGVSNAETSKSNNVTGNQIYNFKVGIDDSNDGADPDYNLYHGNVLTGCTTAVATPVGANSVASDNLTVP